MWCFLFQYKSEGVRGFFKGFTPTALRAWPANAVSALWCRVQICHPFLLGLRAVATAQDISLPEIPLSSKCSTQNHSFYFEFFPVLHMTKKIPPNLRPFDFSSNLIPRFKAQSPLITHCERYTSNLPDPTLKSLFSDQIGVRVGILNWTLAKARAWNCIMVHESGKIVKTPYFDV